MNIERMIQVLNEAHPDIEVFGDDIKEEEVMKNPSFFLYRETNNYTRGQSSRSLIQKVLIQFVTKENKKINIAELAPNLQTAGIHFDFSYEELGKIQGTDDVALMVTMEFTQQVKRCVI